MLSRKNEQSLIILFVLIANSFCQSGTRVLCYYASWNEERNDEYRLFPKDIDPTLCTHLVYAFSMPNLNEGIVPLDFLRNFTEGGAEEFVKLKNINADLKLIISVGGWDEGSIRFSRLTSDPEKAEWFAEYACQFIRHIGFDGIDINWQWPGLREGSNSADKSNFVRFIKAIKNYIYKEALLSQRPPLTLSVILPPLKAITAKGFDIQAIIRDVDYMNLLTMDYHSSTEPLINHPAPLFKLPRPDFDGNLTVDATVQMFINFGIDPLMMNLGIPLYGRSYLLENPVFRDIGSLAEDEGTEGIGTKSPGTLAYYEICKNIRDNGWSVVYPNKTAMGPYAYHDKDWVAFDDVEMIKKKVKYAASKKLGGIMLWTIDLDDFHGICDSNFTLTRVARQVIDASAAVKTNLTLPINNDLSTSTNNRKFILNFGLDNTPPINDQRLNKNFPLPLSTKIMNKSDIVSQSSGNLQPAVIVKRVRNSISYFRTSENFVHRSVKVQYNKNYYKTQN